MSDHLHDIADLLAEVDCQSYSLHVTDRRYYADRSPDSKPSARVDMRLTIVGRTHFEQVAAKLRAKVTERVVHAGQRSWWAEADTPERRLLIEGVSFQHHDDWKSRGKADDDGLFPIDAGGAA